MSASDNREGDRFFVITGMHRSHTSLLGRMLVGAGLRFHDSLVGAEQSNPYGHYEDVDFMRVQEDILRAQGARWYRGLRGKIVIQPENAERLRKLVAERTAKLGPDWGFKVPHSTLFLDFWAEFPGARFLFIVREPAAVLSSLFRRMGSQLYYRPDTWFAMARAYAVYNCRLARHRRLHPERTFLIDSGDLLLQPGAVLQAAAGKLGMPLDLAWRGEQMVDRKIVSAPRQTFEATLTRSFARRADVRAAYEDLVALADSKDLVG